MSIIEIEYEKDFKDDSNSDVLSELSKSIEQKTSVDTGIKKNVVPDELIKNFVSLEEVHDVNNNRLTFHSSMLTFFWPHQLWIILMIKLMYASHHDSGITFLSYIILTFLTLVTALLLADGSTMRFKWVKKLLMRNKKFRQTEEAYEELKNRLENALKNEDFKHEYLAHFQLYKNHYTQIVSELSEKKEVHFNTITYLNNSINELNHRQVNLIKAFAKSNVSESIFLLKKIEEKISKTNEYLQNVKEHSAQDESFLENYHKYLEKTDLVHLLNLSTENESVKNQNTSEEEIKKQINQKL